MAHEGFGADVDKLDRVAHTELPAAAHALIGIVTDHEPTQRPMRVDAVDAMERRYGAFTEAIGRRQRLGCDRVDQIAAALHDIAAVYRRADGQG